MLYGGNVKISRPLGISSERRLCAVAPSTINNIGELFYVFASLTSKSKVFRKDILFK